MAPVAEREYWWWSDRHVGANQRFTEQPRMTEEEFEAWLGRIKEEGAATG